MFFLGTTCCQLASWKWTVMQYTRTAAGACKGTHLQTSLQQLSLYRCAHERICSSLRLDPGKEVRQQCFKQWQVCIKKLRTDEVEHGVVHCDIF